MEENLKQSSEVSEQVTKESENADNSVVSVSETSQNNQELITEEGKSETDPSKELILGKFKNVEELSKAYSELQKYQGKSSEELGLLRKENNAVQKLAGTLQQVWDMKESMIQYLKENREKYNQTEYFQNDDFCKFYNEAFKILGEKLDTDKFVELAENYVKSRVSAYEKNKSAQLETDKVLKSMTYEKNPKSSILPPHKSFDEMTDKEIDDMLEKII